MSEQPSDWFPEHRYLTNALRFGQRLERRGMHRAVRLIEIVNRIVFSADVPVRMPLPEGVYFMHNGLGTVVDHRVRFEGPALIFQHVTLGHTVIGRPGCPVIGADVVIGAGAVIVGPLRVGEGCVIAPGTVVTRDVPARHKAFGNPAQVVPVTPRKRSEVTPGT